jgi:hypothetical protein
VECEIERWPDLRFEHHGDRGPASGRGTCVRLRACRTAGSRAVLDRQTGRVRSPRRSA